MNTRNRNSAVMRPNNLLRENYYQFKLVMLGTLDVGKTALLTRFIRNEFYLLPRLNTIGAAFHTHTMSFDDNIVKLDIWDTAGQERFRSLIPMYYRGTHAVMVVYDIQCRKSFQRAQEWIGTIRQETSPNIVIALIGNKMDQAELRTVNTREADNYARENGLLFMETSARDGTNVAHMFSTVFRELFDKGNGIQQRPIETLRLTENSDDPSKWYDKCTCSVFRR